MIPDGWEEAHLSEVAKVVDCKHRTPSYSENGVPIVSPGNIDWGPINLTACRTTSEEEHLLMMDHCSPKLGDIIYGRNQKVGVGAYVENDKPFSLGQDTVLIKEDGADGGYIYQYLQSDLIARQIHQLQGGSTFSRINLKDIRKMHLNVPALPVQREIAEILSTWGKAIETTEKLIDNAKAQKKALMQQLLTGKKRFPEFEYEEWQTVHLEDIAEVVMGSSPSSSCYNEHQIGLPLIQGNADIKNRISAPRVFTSEITKECRVGDLLLSVRAPVGTISRSQHHACIGRGVAALRAKAAFSKILLTELLLDAEGRWKRFSQGSTFEAINSSDVRKLKLFCSKSIDEQNKIGLTLENKGNEILALKTQLSSLKQQKKALMQQLLTGKRRVKVDGGV